MAKKPVRQKSELSKDLIKKRETGRPANHCVISDNLRSLLDGILIGDGSYPNKTAGLSSYLSISSVATHADWILAIMEALKYHGMEVNAKYYEGYKKLISNGINSGRVINANPYIKLSTKTYRELLAERRRWYLASSKKRIPRDFDVTNPITLACWHMGDGNVSITKNRLCIKLHTNGFSDRDVMWLKKQFRLKLNIKSSISHWRGQPILTMYHREAVKFLDIVRPHIVPSFSYKIPEDPWIPGRCKVCDDPIDDRRSSARYCRRHRRRLRAHLYPNRPPLRCIRCNKLIHNKIYRGKYCPKHREDVKREHIVDMHAKRAEARRKSRMNRQLGAVSKTVSKPEA